MKKTSVLAILIVLPTVFAFLGGCQKNETLTLLNTDNIVVRSGSDYAIENLYAEDQLKVILAKLIARNLGNSHFLAFLKSRLLNEAGISQEIFYLEIKNEMVYGGATFYDFLNSRISSSISEAGWSSILNQANVILPTLVIDLPDWAAMDLSEYSGNDFSVWPCTVRGSVNQDNVSVWHGYEITGTVETSRNDFPVFEKFPIQVKESEQYTLADLSTGRLWSGAYLQSGVFTGIECNDLLNAINNRLGEFSFRYLPGITGSVLLPINELVAFSYAFCAPPLPSSPPPPGCSGACARDCKTEYNYIDGFQLPNMAAYQIINNQPGGEDEFNFVIKFLTAQMCGDLTLPSPCPSNEWERRIGVPSRETFDLVYLKPNDPAPLGGRLLFYIPWGGSSLCGIPRCKIYAVPKAVRLSEIYAPNFILRYLDQLGTNEWDGDHYGNAIQMSVLEHDEITVSVTSTNTTTKSASTKVSKKLTGEGSVELGTFEFSATVTRSATTQYQYNAEKDVLMGDASLNYCNPSYTVDLQDPLSPNTGMIVLYMAFKE